MGMSGSPGSLAAGAEIDERSGVLTRPIEATGRSVIDATFVKTREAGRIVSVAVVSPSR